MVLACFIEAGPAFSGAALDALDAQQLSRHSTSKNSTRSCARFARCCSHCSNNRISSSSSSLAAEEITVIGSKDFRAFFGDANSSSSCEAGNGI